MRNITKRALKFREVIIFLQNFEDLKLKVVSFKCLIYIYIYIFLIHVDAFPLSCRHVSLGRGGPRLPQALQNFENLLLIFQKFKYILYIA